MSKSNDLFLNLNCQKVRSEFRGEAGEDREDVRSGRELWQTEAEASGGEGWTLKPSMACIVNHAQRRAGTRPIRMHPFVSGSCNVSHCIIQQYHLPKGVFFCVNEDWEEKPGFPSKTEHPWSLCPRHVNSLTIIFILVLLFLYMYMCIVYVYVFICVWAHICTVEHTCVYTCVKVRG